MVRGFESATDFDTNFFGGSLYRNKDYAGWEYWIRLHAKGFYPVSDSFVPRFDAKFAQEALEEMKEVTKYLSPDTTTNGLFENFESQR